MREDRSASGNARMSRRSSEDAHAARRGQAKVAAISPHLDDVVLGCAGFLAAHRGATVITVTAGKPPPGPLTDHDGRSGFNEGDDVVAARRREDEAALQVFGARPVWLDFLDHQYGVQAFVSEVAAAVERELDGFQVVAFPLGLGHDDHLLTAAACVEVAHRHPEKKWIVYEDVPYRTTMGGTETALERLRAEGFTLRAARVRTAGALKQKAIGFYPSQVKGLGAHLDDARDPERYWTIKMGR